MNLPATFHDFDNSKDGVERDSVASEPGDFLFRDPKASVVDFDEVNDFFHSRCVGIGSPGLEDFDHGVFGF